MIRDVQLPATDGATCVLYLKTEGVGGGQEVDDGSFSWETGLFQLWTDVAPPVLPTSWPSANCHQQQILSSPSE